MLDDPLDLDPRFLSTPSARRATSAALQHHRLPAISIHALREEGDWDGIVPGDITVKFLSTPSARRATLLQKERPVYKKDFYPRPPRGGRRPAVFFGRRGTVISIHALREEGDLEKVYTQEEPRISIHALREEGDFTGRRTDGTQKISIHALREEGDSSPKPSLWKPSNFYPRPPRGGRRKALTPSLMYL